MIFTQKAAREKIASLESRVSQLESELQASNEREQALQKEISSNTAEVAPLQSKITELSEEIEGLAKSVEELQAENADLTEKATATAEKISIEAARQLGAQGHPEPVATVPDDPKANQLTKAEFDKLTPRQKSDFSRNRGRII